MFQDRETKDQDFEDQYAVLITLLTFSEKLGGKEANFDTAQFIFSENAESTDTLQ